jgi:uncharacterized protein
VGKRRLPAQLPTPAVNLGTDPHLPGALDQRSTARTVSDASAVVALGAAVALVAAGRTAGIGELAGVETFVLIFASIVLEALPFVLLGALVSALIAAYVPGRLFDRIAKLPLALQLPGAAFGGFAFPVCDCGSVPVARRLIARGLHPVAGVAFMLAAPVINPIVLGSTWVAYSGRGLAAEMVLGRAALGLLLALAGGLALRSRFSVAMLRSGSEEHHRSHASTRNAAFIEHLVGDFLFMGKFIVLGAGVAAAMQTTISPGIIGSLGGTPVVSTLALMALAFVLSLCSEADAFVAVSFTPFSLGSQLAFLGFGPIMDLKLAMLYGGTFRRRFVVALAVIAVPILVIASAVFDASVR